MDKVTSITDALGWITPLIGAGGLTAIVVAYLGTRKPAQIPPSESVGISALLADRFAMERLANELSRINDNLAQIARGMDRYCDLMDITQALDRLHKTEK